MPDLFRQLAETIFARVVRAFSNWPTLGGWGEVASIFALFCLIALPIGFWFGLLEWKPSQDSAGQLALVAIVAVFVPSLLEETVYRALLLPTPEEDWSLAATIGMTAISVALFVAGHPLVAWLFAPDARKLFYDPVFLVLSALFGIAASIAYLRTGSIWPSVAMHWAVVVAWVYWLGGWIMAFGPK